MLQWKTHTPEGVQDILAEDSAGLDRAGEAVRGVFQSFGYAMMRTPSLEYYDVFAGEGAAVSQEKMFKFFDPSGRILVLRPDLTTPIARVAGTKLEGEPLPYRFSYIGNTFVNSGDRKEITQGGLELIGVRSPEADAEVIAAAIEAILKAGLKDFQIEIGQVAFFKGLLESAGLSADQSEALRVAVDTKDTLAVSDLVREAGVSASLAELLVKLPELFGGVEVLDAVNLDLLNDEAKGALCHLRQVYEILCDYGFMRYVSIDLGMVQRMDYYTGTIFRGFTYGVGFPICSGGRYDGLIKTFGRDLPAMGAAIDISGLHMAMKRQGIGEGDTCPEVLAAYGAEERSEALLAAMKLREKGKTVETALMPLSKEEAIALAKEKGIPSLCYGGRETEEINCP